MIILDTNVISEVMAPSQALQVVDWMDATPVADLATTTINVAEIRFGLARLPFGQRRERMEMLFENLLERAVRNRIFAFDDRAADAFGALAAARERSGRRLAGFDGLVVAIAFSRGAAIATRNVRDFAGCGVSLINPWDTDETR